MEGRVGKALERYLKTVRTPQPDADALAAMETSMLEAGHLLDLITALKTRLQVLEERDGPQPLSLSLRKRLADVLMQHANTAAEDVLAAQSAVEAMELYAHALNDVDGLKAAATVACVRAGSDPAVRRATSERLGGDDQLQKLLKRALKEETAPARKAPLAYTLGALREAADDKTGAFTDFMRAARWQPGQRLHVDELMRSSLEQDRHQEAEMVLGELAQDPNAALQPDGRAYVWSKLGTLRAHLGQEREALDAFVRSLELDPNLKASVKQARRLADKLGVPFEPPPPRVMDTAAVAGPPVQAAPPSDPTPLPDATPAPEDPGLPGRPAFLYERTGPALLSDLPYRIPDPLRVGPSATVDLQPPVPRLLAHGFPGAGEISSVSLPPVVSIPPFRGPDDESSGPKRLPQPVLDERTPISQEVSPLGPLASPVESTLVSAPPQDMAAALPSSVPVPLESLEPRDVPQPLEDAPRVEVAAFAVPSDETTAPLQPIPAPVVLVAHAPAAVDLGAPAPLAVDPDEPSGAFAPEQGPQALLDLADVEPAAVVPPTPVMDDPTPVALEPTPVAAEPTPVTAEPTPPPGPPPQLSEPTMVDSSAPMQDGGSGPQPAVSQEATPAQDTPPAEGTSPPEMLPAAEPAQLAGAPPEDEPTGPGFPPDVEDTGPLDPPPFSAEQAAEDATPPAPSTPEEFLRAGQPEAAVPLLLARLAQNPRVADMMLLADLHETALDKPEEAITFHARAALRLVERGDPHDIMLRRCVDGAIRTGAANPGALTRLAGALAGKLLPEDDAALARAAARAIQGQDRGAAAALLSAAYERAPSSTSAALYDEADRALGLAMDRRGQAHLRQLKRARATDPRERALLSRERADLLKFEGTRVFAAALMAVLEDDPADGSALEKLLATWEHARSRGEPVASELASALATAARSQKGEAGLPHLRRLARLREEMGDPVEALRAWRDVLARRPGDAEALKSLTELLELTSRSSPERLAELADVLSMRLTIARNMRDTPGLAALLPRLATVQARLGREEERVALLREVLRVDADNEAALGVVEASLTEAGAFEDLAALWEDLAARRSTTQARTAAMLAAAILWQERVGQVKRARDCLEDVLKTSPDHPTALLHLAEVCLEMGQAELGQQHLTRAAGLLKGPPRGRALARLAALQESKEQLEEASRSYREALVADPGQRQTLEALLALAHRMGRSADARAVAADLASMEPDPVRRADAFLDLARRAREAGENEVALRLYDTAFNGDPSRLDAAEELAWLLVQRGEGRRARPLLEKLVAVRGVDAVPPPLLVSLAKTVWASGEVNLAKDRLRAALRKDPGMLEALRALGDLLLAGKDEDPQEVLTVLEQRVLHHGEKLEKEELAFIHAQAGRLRAGLGDKPGAQRSLKRALQLMPAERPDPDALETLARLTEGDGRLEEAQELYTRLARRLSGAAAAGAWVKAGHLARQRADTHGAATAYQEARRLDPSRTDAARALLEVEVARGNSAAAVTAMMDLLTREQDPARQASLHLSLARLHRDGAQDEKAALHLRKALELEPTSSDAMALAEQIFVDRKDARGLVGVYTSSIRNLPAAAVEEKIGLWDKVALIRRYELKDLPGAVTALEEILKLDENHVKAREDLARLYVELGNADQALAAWLLLLSRDPLNVDAYRGMLAIFRRQMAYDAAYCVCATLVALDEADEDNRGVVRALRPPFPTWPRPTSDADATVRRIQHPRLRGPARDLLAALAPSVVPLFSKPLAHHNLTKKALVTLDEAPPSFSLAAKHAMRLLGLPTINLFRGDGGTGINLVVSDVSGLVLAPDALKGGMTPERAYSFGRAALYLRPENTLLALVDAGQLRALLEAVVLRANPAAEVEGNRVELDRLGREVERVVPPAEWPRMLLLARDWWRDRGSQPVAEVTNAAAFSADRVGFLFAQDLAAAVASIRQHLGAMTAHGTRAAIRELVLFSVSPEYLALRQELGPSVNSSAAARLFGDP